MEIIYQALPYLSEEPNGPWCICASHGVPHLRDHRFTETQARAIATELNKAFDDGAQERGREVGQLLIKTLGAKYAREFLDLAAKNGSPDA